MRLEDNDLIQEGEHMKICIDAGHYAKYNKSPVNDKYYESEMTWKLHEYLKKELESLGIKVITTRSDQTKDLGLTSRGNKASGCDLFLSIHSNACNTESEDFPLACCSVSGKADAIGKKLADTVASVMGTKQNGRIWKRRGKFGDYYGVLRGAAAVGVPGVLLEHSFHTNRKATEWLLVDSNLKKLAKAEAKTIASFYGIKTSSDNTTTDDKSSLYKVQVGAFSKKENAVKLCKELKAKGYDAIVIS